MRPGARAWTPEDEERLLEAHGRGVSVEALADWLERTPNAIRVRLQRLGAITPPDFDAVSDPMERWGHGIPGRTRYWTKERVTEALQAYVKRTAGMLPSTSDEYNVLKVGDPTLPPSSRVLEYYGAMARAWLQLGAPRARCPLLGCAWTEEEVTYLLDHAGERTLNSIAKSLHRSYASCRRKLYDLGTRARDAQGTMNATQAARELGVPVNRVQDLINKGVLKARHPAGKRNMLAIEVEDLEAVRHLLTAPRQPVQDDPFNRWLSMQEAADRLGYVFGTVSTWARNGLFPTTKFGKKVYVRERDLKGFVPPSERPAGFTPEQIAALPVMKHRVQEGNAVA